jgi:hypothetical protein
VRLDDWNSFNAIFLEAGIDLQSGCTNPDNGTISQNVVHQLHLGANASQPILNRLWKRIDFGPRSIRLDYERLLKHLQENDQDIRETLKVGRYDMICWPADTCSTEGKSILKNVRDWECLSWTTACRLWLILTPEEWAMRAHARFDSNQEQPDDSSHPPPGGIMGKKYSRTTRHLGAITRPLPSQEPVYLLLSSGRPKVHLELESSRLSCMLDLQRETPLRYDCSCSKCESYPCRGCNLIQPAPRRLYMTQADRI